MPTKSLKEKLRKTFLIAGCFLFVFIAYLLAADRVYSEEDAFGLRESAREYREEGFRLQSIGDLESAMKYYQKAAEFDPEYAIVFNDMAIIYEAKGMADEAEANYLKAIKIDPYYLSTYSNLALFYENKRELGKAAYCWKKRYELGDPNDPWTMKARQRLEDMRVVLSKRPLGDAQEKEVINLMKDIANEKYILKTDDKAMARKKFREAKLSYNKEDYATAIRDALDAQYLDPDNKAIEDFIDKAQSRALSR